MRPYMDEMSRAAAEATANNQATALEAAPPPPDTGMQGQSAAEAAGYTGERKDESTFGGEEYDKDWDPAWERRARKLLGNEVVGSDKDLFDPKHRAWINKQMKKKRAEKRAQPAEGGGETAETGGTEETPPQAPATGGTEPMPNAYPPAMSNNQVKPRVLAGGRLPGGGEIFQTTAGPWGSGWIPAGNGLWWPPYPVAGGPIAKPGPRRRRGQAEPMPRTLTADGQANAMERG